jgi:hypothetical protein
MLQVSGRLGNKGKGIFEFFSAEKLYFLFAPVRPQGIGNPPLPKRKEIPTGLRESLGGFLLLAPFEPGSLHKRSGPQRPLGTRPTWYSKARNRVIVPAEKI